MQPLDLAAEIVGQLPYTPNSQQLGLIAALGRYLSDLAEGDATAPSADRVFLLNGYAGTGKTSVTGALVRALTARHIPVVLMAPTGRAAKVLAASCAHIATTIHRRIYRGDTVGSPGMAPIVNENRLRDAVFIVDEASMIGGGDGSYLLEDLMHYVFSGINCRLILLGDTAQLPPVGCTESPAMNPEVLRAMGLRTTRVTITAPARQGARSGILYNATRQRLNMAAEQPVAPVVYASRFDDVRVVDEPEALADDVTADYTATPDGPAETIIITRSNRRATEFNNSVRRDIFDYDTDLAVGERLLVVKNNYLWCRKIEGLDFIANGDVAVVERIIAREERYSLRWADVELTLPDHNVTFQAKIMVDTLVSLSAGLDADYEQAFQQALMADSSIVPHGATPAQVHRALRDNPYYNALRVKYAYCVTCHKAQGGQWRNVYIDTGYVPPEADYTEFCRWLYTATTRATGRLTFINPPFAIK